LSRSIPAAIEAERAILGGLIGEADDAALMADVAGRIRAADFAFAPHGEIWGLLFRRWADRKPLDLVSLIPDVRSEAGKFGGLDYVLDLPGHCPSTANLSHYVGQVLESSARRTAVGILEPALERLFNREPVAAVTESLVVELLQASPSHGGGDWEWLGDLAGQALQEHDDVADGTRAPGLMLGLPPLDRHLGGLTETDLVIMAARPAMGKTALAVQAGIHVASTVGPTAMFSLEMPGTQLARRILAQRARTSGKLIRTGELSDEARDRVVQAAAAAREIPFAVLARPVGIGELIAKVRTLSLRCNAKKTPLRLLIVDYLQLVSGDERAGNREQEIAGITKALKQQICLDMKIPVILVAQLNRQSEHRKDKRPEIADLRESGAIEQDADRILFPFRPGYYAPERADLQNRAEIIIAKDRHSGPGIVEVGWNGDRTEFYDPAQRLRLA
jgi:replicative DNA helicase